MLILVPDFGDHSFARLWCEVRQATVLVRYGNAVFRFW